MNLKELRFKKNKTQWDLFREAGVHQSKISLIERGYVRPTRKEKMRIAEVLGVAATEIDWASEEAVRQ